MRMKPISIYQPCASASAFPPLRLATCTAVELAELLGAVNVGAACVVAPYVIVVVGSALGVALLATNVAVVTAGGTAMTVVEITLVLKDGVVTVVGADAVVKIEATDVLLMLEDTKDTDEIDVTDVDAEVAGAALPTSVDPAWKVVTDPCPYH